MSAESKTELFRNGAVTLAGFHPATPRLQRLFAEIEEAARDDSVAIFLTGETGTGKTLAAQAAHNASPRAKKTFLPFDLSAEQPTVLRATLFGHEKGAFTGADARSDGAFQAAKGGTLFLDEIGDLEWDVQGALRHAVDYHQVRRVGAKKLESVDVRIICATNVPLERIEREKDRFREDLFMRLRQSVFQLPPLREVPDEIPGIVKALVEERTIERGRPPVEVADSAMARLMEHGWPGNVRELKHAVRAALVRCKDGVLRASDLRLGATGSGEWTDRRTMRERTEQWAYQVWLACGRNSTEAGRVLDVDEKTVRRGVARWRQRFGPDPTADAQDRTTA